MSDQTQPMDGGNGHEVDRIRDIIFGSQMKTIDSHLGALRADIEQLRQLHGRLQAQLAEVDAEQSRRLQGLRAETADDLEVLRTELRASTQRLDHAKADRETLGRLLVDLGQQLLDGQRPLAERLQALGHPAAH